MRRPRGGEFLEILAQDVRGLPVDIDRREAVTEAGPSRPRSACGRRPGHHRASTASGAASLDRMPGRMLRSLAVQPPRDRARQPSEGWRSRRWNVVRRPCPTPKLRSPCHAKAFINDQRVLVEEDLQMSEPRFSGDRPREPFQRQRAVVQCPTDHLVQARPVRWRQAVVALPARKLPHPTGCPQRQIDTTVLGRQQMGRTAETRTS